jgi:hypothetical protein
MATGTVICCDKCNVSSNDVRPPEEWGTVAGFLIGEGFIPEPIRLDFCPKCLASIKCPMIISGVDAEKTPD